MLIGLDNIDTDKARTLINNSKDQINTIIYDCEKRFNDYPKFNNLKNDLLKLKMDLDNEEKQLDVFDNKVNNYKNGPMVKTLGLTKIKK